MVKWIDCWIEIAVVMGMVIGSSADSTEMLE